VGARSSAAQGEARQASSEAKKKERLGDEARRTRRAWASEATGTGTAYEYETRRARSYKEMRATGQYNRRGVVQCPTRRGGVEEKMRHDALRSLARRRPVRTAWPLKLGHRQLRYRWSRPSWLRPRPPHRQPAIKLRIMSRSHWWWRHPFIVPSPWSTPSQSSPAHIANPIGANPVGAPIPIGCPPILCATPFWAWCGDVPAQNLAKSAGVAPAASVGTSC